MAFKDKLKETLTIKFDKAFGLDISDRSVEIIELEKVFRFSVTTYGREELAPGVVENGRILDANALALKLKTLLKEVKPKRVSTNKAIISLPETQVFIQCFTVDANLKSTELSEAILDKVGTILPLNPDKMYWDFIRKPLPDKTKALIIFVGVPRDIASGYVKFCNSIGLEVVSLSVESLSLARAILKKSDRQSLIMDIGTLSTSLNFFDSNDCAQMSVIIPLAGQNFTDAIKTKLNLEGPDADDLKAKFGFKDSSENNIRPHVLPVLDEMVKEVKDAINYYEATFKQKLDDVYLIGGSALMPGIAEEIKLRIDRPIQIAVSGHNINLKSLAGKAGNSFPLFANVIGLGMLGASGEFQDINLLKKMPRAEVNTIDKLNLFKLGYLSKVNTIRAIFNNKYVLITVIILIGVIFAVLLQQAKNFGYASVSSSIVPGL
jgi:type IV pilus assembly protein PilM